MTLFIREPEIFIQDLPYVCSIKVNNIFLYPDALSHKASKFVRPALLYHADYLNYPGLVGSATLIRHNKINYAIVTRHQHDHMRPNNKLFGYSKLYIASLGKEITSLPFDKIITPLGDGNESEEITALVISDQQPNAKDYYNHIETRDPDGDAREAIYSFIIGYTMADSTITYNSTSQPLVSPNQVQLGCARDYLYQSHEDYLHTYNLENSSSRCLNGCSGGALFSIRNRNLEYQLELDGIIVRGGRGKVYIISTSLFFDFLH